MNRTTIERLLAKEPADRYDSTRDLYRELRQIRERLSETTSGIQTASTAQTAKGPTTKPKANAYSTVWRSRRWAARWRG
jgi:hypothetical protein